MAEIVAEDLVEARLLDPLDVENAIQGVSPNSIAVAQDQRCSGARNNARAEIDVGFGAAAGIEREARMRTIAESQKAGLIVAASVADLNRARGRVFDFLSVAGGIAEVSRPRACLQ